MQYNSLVAKVRFICTNSVIPLKLYGEAFQFPFKAALRPAADRSDYDTQNAIKWTVRIHCVRQYKPG